MKEKPNAKSVERFYGYRVNGDGGGTAHVDVADLARSPKVRKQVEAIRQIKVEPSKND